MHASFSTIRKFLDDGISRGQLAKLVQKVSRGLRASYEELLHALPSEPRLNVDETGHSDRGRRLWTWCFRSELFTLYRIDPSRGSDVLVDVLGEEFDGLLGCDYFSAYRKYMKDFDVRVQLCLARRIRDVKFLIKHPSRTNRRYGETLLAHLRKLFATIHRRDAFASGESFRRTLVAIRNRLVTDAIMQLPRTREAGNVADRFANDLDSYFRFISEPNIEPTNNLAEQAIRFVAIHRRITQGTRGAVGQRWCERIWTVVQTCSQQGHSAFDFLAATVAAQFQSPPSRHRCCRTARSRPANGKATTVTSQPLPAEPHLNRRPNTPCKASRTDASRERLHDSFGRCSTSGPTMNRMRTWRTGG